MPGVTNVHEDSYTTEVAITERYTFVVIGAAAGKCKLPAASGDEEKVLGIAQTTAKLGETVLVRRGGSSYLVAGGVIARGGDIQAKTTGGNEGRGIALAAPAAPAGAANPPTTANVDAVSTYVTDTLNYMQRSVATAETAASAAGDIIIANLGRPGMV